MRFDPPRRPPGLGVRCGGAPGDLGSGHFIEMLLAQPVGRGALYAGLFGGLVLPLSGAFLLGVGVPLLIQGGEGSLDPDEGVVKVSSKELIDEDFFTENPHRL